MSALPQGPYADYSYPQISASGVSEVECTTTTTIVPLTQGFGEPIGSPYRPNDPSFWTWEIRNSEYSQVPGYNSLFLVGILVANASDTQPPTAYQGVYYFDGSKRYGSYATAPTLWSVAPGSNSLFIEANPGYQYYEYMIPSGAPGAGQMIEPPYGITYQQYDAKSRTLVVMETDVWVKCTLTMDKMVASVAEVDANNFSVSCTATVHGGNAPYTYAWSYYAYYLSTPIGVCPYAVVSGGGPSDASITVQAAKRFKDAVGRIAPVYIVIGCSVTDIGRCYVEGDAAVGTWTKHSPLDGTVLTLGMALARDVSRRTIAVKPDGGNRDGGLLFLFTSDAGHSFNSSPIGGVGSAAWPCLAVSKSTGKVTLFFANKAGMQIQSSPNVPYIQGIYAREDGEGTGDWYGLPLLWPGDYPAIAAQGSRLALAYQDQGALKMRMSGDLGVTWDDPETVLTQFDGTAGGRVALAWVGETLRMAVPGTALTVVTNAPLGNGPPGWHQSSAPGNNPIQCLSLLALPGVLLLSGAEGDGSAANPLHTVLRRSEDGGQHWDVEAQSPPGTGNVLGLVPETSRLLWGTDYHSDNDGQTWLGN